MQSSLIRVSPRLLRRPLAWLTLCAIAAPSSPAWAETAPGSDVIGSPRVSPANDDTAVADSATPTPARADDEDESSSKPARLAMWFGASGVPLVTGAPLASFTL